MSFWWCKTWDSGDTKGLPEAAGSKNVFVKTVDRIQGCSWCVVCKSSPTQKSKHCHGAICRLSGVAQHPLCLTLLWCLLMPPCSIPVLWLCTSRRIWMLNNFSRLHISSLGYSIWHCHIGEHVVISFAFIFSRLQTDQINRGELAFWVLDGWVVHLHRLWMCRLYVCVDHGCVDSMSV